jgi:hypothetical protein
MPTIKIPDEHHVLRHCKFKEYFWVNGKIRPHPEAFHLKPPTSKYPQEEWLSAIYYEWLEGTPFEKLAAAVNYIQIEMKRKDALLRLNAGSIREQGSQRSIKLRVSHEADGTCPPYATIRGVPIDPDDELCRLLSTLALVEAVEVSAI